MCLCANISFTKNPINVVDRCYIIIAANGGNANGQAPLGEVTMDALRASARAAEERKKAQQAAAASVAGGADGGTVPPIAATTATMSESRFGSFSFLAFLPECEVDLTKL